MDIEKLKEELRRDEGLRLHAYRDTEGYWTIGYGHCLIGNQHDIGKLRSVGISKDQADYWLDADIKAAISIVRFFCLTFYELTDARQRVLVNMAFNLGTRLHKFVRFKAAIESGDYDLAAEEMLDSKWAKQVGQRAVRLADMMREG